MSFVFNGKTYDIPGSYGILEVIQNSGANIPDFQVGLIIGRSIKGIPYSASGKTGSELMPAYDNGVDLLRDYGDDNIYQAYKYMTKHGGGLVFVLNALDNTACSVPLKDNAEPAKNAVILTAKENWYGICANDIKLELAGTTTKTLTLTPPKNVKTLVADSGTTDHIYVNSVLGLKVGEKVFLTSNVTASPVEYTIAGIDNVRSQVPYSSPAVYGYRITFTDDVDTGVLISNYARIYQVDLDNVEEFTWASTVSIPTIVSVINSTSVLVKASIGETGAVQPVNVSETHLQDMTGATKGTSSYTTSEAAADDYEDICGSFPDWMKDFINVNKVKIRLMYVDSSNATVHGYFRDLAATMRANRSPICVIAGAGLGENAAALAVRAKAINSDDFVLCGAGADNLPANLSFAPSVLGIKMNNGVNHNLTRDALNFNSVEADWSDSDLTTLLKNGVFVYDKFPSGYRVVRGINTYQDQTHVWNAQDRKTYLQMPRDLADAFFRGLLEGLDSDLVGSDQVTRKKVETYCVKTGNNFKASGLINDFKVLAIKRGEAGWLPEVQIEVDDPTDFFGTRVFVISPSLG